MPVNFYDSKICNVQLLAHIMSLSCV